MIVMPDGHLLFRHGSPELVVAMLLPRAARRMYDGRETPANLRHLASCTADHLPTETRVMFTRDVDHHFSGWFKNPDYERCLHLSTSFRERATGGKLPQRPAISRIWANLFFGHHVRLAWIEGAHTPIGKSGDVLHFRVFCDEHWRPIKPRGEVYSSKFTELGWKSFSELERDIVSPLSPD